MDDVLLNKSAIIERSLNRINEEFTSSEQLKTDFTKQDSITLNLLRACEAAIDSAMHIVRVKKLGVPQSSRHAFELLQQAGLIELAVAQKMKAMVGFRNIAVHDYQKLSLEIMEMIVVHNLSDFTDFTKGLLSIAPNKKR